VTRPRAGESSAPSADRGSAVVEFVVVGVGVLVPLVYLLQVVGALHSAVLASGAAAREAGRAFSTAPTVEQARVRAESAARLAFADQGLTLPAGSLRVQCLDGACLSPGSSVVVSIDWTARLPWLPDTWAREAGVPVSARQQLPIDDYRSSPDEETR
jgi:hypothetical protein